MKFLTVIILVAIISCNDPQQNVQEPSKTDTTNSSASVRPPNNSETCWTGTLNGTTPVFLHYQIDSNIIIGEIKYLNTKDKLPITIVGTIENGKGYRLLEFEPSGNITGVISGQPTGDIFKGDWVSPKTKKEFALDLIKKDTIINSPSIRTEVEKVFGEYHYQYSEKGYQGDFVIKKLSDFKASFEITSVTSDPARNVAQIDNDTITLKTTQFSYEMPNTTDCGFSVKFYKDFLVVQYTKGFCEGQFGNNADIDGIFIKVK